jgi:FeS assembly SUF system regulator
MMRIGKLTDYATVILATLASDRARLLNAGTLAERTHIAAPTVAKLLKQLQRAGLVNSARGTYGGYQLSRSPDHISAAAILDALEGPLALTDCSVGVGNCCLEHSCGVGRSWQRLNAAIRKSLADVSLAQLAGLDARTPAMPIERELRQFTRPKAPA